MATAGAELVHTFSEATTSETPRSPAESLSAFSNVDLADEPATPSYFYSKTGDEENGSISTAAVVLGPTSTAVNASSILEQAQSIDADIEELQHVLVRVTNAMEQARAVTDRQELEVTAARVRQELEYALAVVKKSIHAQVAQMQQESAASLRAPGCGLGTPTFHMRQTVATSVKNKLIRRKDNVLDLESRLNMGIRDTAKRRYMEVMSTAPSDGLVDRLCSPAPPECKLGTLGRREPEQDDKMASLLKEMEIRNSLAIDTSRMLNALERELTFVVDVLEHEESAMKYELSVEKANRRGFAACVCLAFVVFLFVVFGIPGLALYL